MKSYKELEAWKRSRLLVKTIYQATKSFPSGEKFELVGQMRRSAISAPSNIAEGFGRNTTKDTIQFLHIARGSLYELETQLLLCFDLGYIPEKTSSELCLEVNEICKILNGLITYLETKK